MNKHVIKGAIPPNRFGYLAGIFSHGKGILFEKQNTTQQKTTRKNAAFKIPGLWIKQEIQGKR